MVAILSDIYVKELIIFASMKGLYLIYINIVCDFLYGSRCIKDIKFYANSECLISVEFTQV